MRSRIILTALALVAGGALALPGASASAQTASDHLPTHVNDCWSTDREPPVVDSVTVTPSTVDTGSPVTVHIAVSAHDVGGPGPATGIGKVEVSLLSASGTSLPDTVLTHRKDGLWHGAVTVPTGTEGSFYADVRAWDHSGRYKLSLQFDQPSEKTFLDVLQAGVADPGAHDLTPPTLTGLHLSTTSVDTRSAAKVLTITADATDDDSGVATVRATLFPQRAPAIQVDLKPTGTPGQFRGTHRYLRGLGNHQEPLWVTLVDHNGNQVADKKADLSKLGVPTRITVRSGAYEGPRVVRVLKAAPKVDVHIKGMRYPIRLLMSDPQGVASVSASMRGAASTMPLTKVSGTRKRGVWQGYVKVLRCSFSLSTVPLTVVATDRGGAIHHPTVRQVRILSSDHIPPRAHGRPFNVSPTVFTFHEPVHGISPATVETFDFDLHQISGTWKCRRGKNGGSARVNCRTGSLQRATFYPDDAGTILGMVNWEPGEHLDVLDAHGNPVADYTTYNPQVLD
ncbi:MAG: hypothetical protein QM747_01300 [Nocardioides sp.]